MKKRHFLFLTLLLLVGIVSCEKEQVEDLDKPSIKFSLEEVGIDAYGNEVELKYTIENVDKADMSALSATCDADWLNIDINDDAVLFSAERNEDEKHRTTDVTFSYEGAESVSLRVIQAGGAEKEIPTVKIEITDVSSTIITFDVTTSHPDITWIPMVTYKEYWTEPVNDLEIVSTDLEYFQYLADISGVTLETFLSEMLGKGSETGIMIERLTPSTEYVVYVYGLSVEGECLTAISWDSAMTDEPYEGDITFEFDVKEEDFVMEFVITPSYLGVDYYYGVATEAEIEMWKQLAGSDDLAAAIQLGDIEYTIQDLMDYNLIDERRDYYDSFNSYNVVDDGWMSVDAATTYVLYAAKWNDNCEITGEVSTATYTTPSAGLSNNVITLDITEITQSSVTVAVTTTNYDPYVIIPVSTSAVEGMTDTEIFEYIMSEYSVLAKEYTFEGNWSKTFGRMRPGNSYTILAFGCLAGVQTTDMIKREVTTLESGDPKDCTFEFLCVPDSDNVWLEIIPSDKGHHYFYEIYPADYTEEDAKSFIRYIMNEDYEGNIPAFSSWRLYQGDLVTTEYDLRPLTDYKLGVVIMDYDTGEFLSDVFFSEVFTTTEPSYANITITVNWDKYYDADELAAAGYSQYAGNSGHFILPVSVEVIGEYAEFYYAFFKNDLTDEVPFTDEMFYQDLNYSGYKIKNVILALPYDTPMTAVAVAYDYGFQPSKLFRKLLNYSKSGASPVSEYGVASMPMPLAKSLVVASEPEVEAVGSERNVPLVHIDSEITAAKTQAFVREMRQKKAQDKVERRSENVDGASRRIAR